MTPCLCPICKTSYRPGPYAQHMKRHLRRGEVEKREQVRPERANNTRGYTWSNPFVYVLKKGV